MPDYPPVPTPPPNYWTIFGHSYWQYAFGTRTQAGRSDALFRATLGVEFADYANHGVVGAKLTWSGNSQGGWTRVLQNCNGSRNSRSPINQDVSPFVANQGAYLIGWGINDVGQGQTTQYHTAYQQAMRTVISRCRLSAVRNSDYAGAAGTGVIAYGAGFVQTAFTGDQSSSTSYRTANSTTNATVTITLPTIYNGETVTVCFIVDAGAVGGVVGFSGTSGASGTLTLSGIMPVSTSSIPVVKRFTNFTAAQAGTTIIITVNSLDGSGNVHFDSWWIEAAVPPPVVVCNTPRLTSTGYSGYTGPPVDSDVNLFNTYLTAVVAEFDSMVQIADIDSALQKDATLFAADGVHPNEFGAGRVADAVAAAVGNLTPTGRYGQTAQINPPSPKKGPLCRPHQLGFWYAPDTFGGPNGSAYTPVSGDAFALPFWVSDATATFTRWSVETLTSSVATTVWISIYDDRQMRGYPQYPYTTPTASAFTLTTGAAVTLSPTTNGNGFLFINPDPGLYWLYIKIATAGTSTLRTMKGPSLWVPSLTTGGAGGTTPCAWFLSGQGVGAPSTIFGSGATAVDNAPMIGLLVGN
jgi:lysophospholipase L1-like esterase